MQMETSANDAISFLDVPADIRHAIFRAIPPATLTRCSLVNKYFTTDAFSALFHVDLTSFMPKLRGKDEAAEAEADPTKVNPPFPLSRLQRVRALKIKHTESTKYEDLLHLTSLTALEADCSNSLLSVLPLLTQLKSLDLRDGIFPDNYPTTSTSLQRIAVSKVGDSWSPGLLSPVQNLKHFVAKFSASLPFIEAVCTHPLLEIVDTNPIEDLTLFETISSLAPQRPRFVTGGRTYFLFCTAPSITNHSRIVDLSQKHPSATLDVNAVSPVSNLPTLHDCFIQLRDRPIRPKEIRALLALLDLGADVNTLVPLGAVPGLRRFSRLDPTNKWGVPALIAALASGFKNEDVLATIRQKTKDIASSPIPAWMAALTGWNPREDPLDDIVKDLAGLNPLQHYTLVSPQSDLVWLRTSFLLEIYRAKYPHAFAIVDDMCTPEVFEAHRSELRQDFLSFSSRGSSLSHNICRFPRPKDAEPFFNCIRKLLRIFQGATFVEDSAGLYPLDFWFLSKLPYLEEWQLSPEMFCKLLFLPLDDPRRKAHGAIVTMLNNNSANNYKFGQCVFQYALGQGDQFVSDFLEKIVLEAPANVLLCLLCGISRLADEHVLRTVDALRRSLVVQPHLLRPALRALLASEKRINHITFLLLFAAVGLEEAKAPEFLWTAVQTRTIHGPDELSLLLECGCSPTHPKLLDFLAAASEYELLAMLVDHGAPLVGRTIASFGSPTSVDQVRGYKRFIASLARARASPVNADGKCPPMENLFQLLSSGIERALLPPVWILEETDRIVLEALSALVGAGAPFPDPSYLLILSIKGGLPLSAISPLVAAIPLGSLDAHGVWKSLLFVPEPKYKDFELVWMCDALERRSLLFDGIDSRIEYIDHEYCRLAVFDRVLQIAGSKPYLEAPQGRTTLLTLAPNFVFSALKSSRSGKDAFFRSVSGMNVTKDGCPVQLVEEPEVQTALLKKCSSTDDVVSLAAYDILLPDSLNEYCKHFSADRRKEIDAMIERQKGVVQRAARNSVFGSSIAKTDFFTAKPQNASSFSSPSVEVSSPFGSSSAATPLFTGGSPFGISTPSTVPSVGFAAPSNEEQPSASSLFAASSPFGISAPPASPFGFSGEIKDLPPPSFSGFASNAMPALTEVDFGTASQSSSSQPSTSRRPMAKKSNFRKK